MKEFFAIVWFCVTPANAECRALDNTVHGVRIWHKPDEFYDPDRCQTAAEFYADLWWNEKHFKVEYGCRPMSKPWDVYVPRRRF